MFNELRFVHALIEFGSFAQHEVIGAEPEIRELIQIVQQFDGLLTQVCSGCQVAAKEGHELSH